MIDLELEVNSVDFHLFEEIDKDKLKNLNAKIVGFFTKRLLKPIRGERIYFSKNCYIELFKSLKNQEGTYIDKLEGKVIKEFVFGPNVSKSGYLSGHWGTSIYLHYINNKLSKITFQTIYNRIMAKKVIKEFEKRMIKIYGEPDCNKQNENRICMWTDENSVVITELNGNLQHSFIHWITQGEK